MYTRILLLACVVTLGSVSSFPNVNVDEDRNYERTPLGDAIDKASLKLLREAYKSGDDKNVITSPLGIMILLSMYSAGAGPVSQTEISQLLGGTDLKQISKSYSDLSSDFAKMNPEYFTLANRIYVQEGLALKDTFSQSVRTYNSDVLNINYRDVAKAAEIINKWSNETTKGTIPDPIKPDTLDEETILGLFNIIFFKGHWTVPFKSEDTREEDFHVDTKTVVKKPTMNLERPLYYAETKDIGARMIELPYKEKGFRMVVVLPDEVDGLPQVLEKVAEHGLLENVFKLQRSGLDVQLHLPKFEVKTRLDLNTLLPKIGVSSIFDEPTNGVVEGDEPVKVTKGFQEALVKVDEEGSTAAAFTGFGIAFATSFISRPEPIHFKVDRPFMFSILYQDKVLFAGTYTH